ncbi:hypothetical protein ACFL1Q_02845 [Patescibacteria group bacterium]
MKQKKVFLIILIAVVIILVLTPFTLSFNDVLTKQVEKLQWYIWIQDRVVPIGVRLVGVVMKALGINFVAYKDGFTVNEIPGRLSWNCLGWQSLVLFFVSVVFGFSAGKYTFISKTITLVTGLLGLFLMNLFTIVLIVVLLIVSKPLYAIVFHDYFAAIATMLYLILFWWYSYSYTLEEKET